MRHEVRLLVASRETWEIVRMMSYGRGLGPSCLGREPTGKLRLIELPVCLQALVRSCPPTTKRLTAED